MSFSLKGYQTKRQELAENIDLLSIQLGEMGNSIENEKVKTIRGELIDDQFQVAVVGEFSRGKSTLINALLGERVLPASVKPTTALLNIISYQDSPSITLHYHDEKKASEQISKDQFKALVAPKDPLQGDKESEAEYKQAIDTLKAIRYAAIGQPLNFCSNGVTIIDTPGTNDLDPIREQVTNNIIPKADAAILILSAIKILSESEISFLRDRLLANDIQKIFIVINFKDQLEDDEAIKKVMDYAHEHLEGILDDPRIFLVAAKHALNARRIANGEKLTVRGRPVKVWDFERTGFGEFEADLADFLANDRGKIKLQKPIKQLKNLVDTVVNKQLKVQQRSLEMQMEGLKEKVEAFYPKLDHVKKVGDNALSKISFELDKEKERLKTWYKQQLNHISEQGLRTFDDNRHLAVEKISRKVENKIAPLERKLHEDKKEKIQEAVKATINKSSKQVNEEWFKIEGDFDSLLEPNNSLSVNLAEYSEAGPSIFDEIFDELDTAWTKSNSFLGKVGIGVGFVATAVVGGITALFKAGWAWFTGEDEKTKFKRQLVEQFDETRKEKIKSFDKEFQAVKNGVESQYKQIIQTRVEQMENQLNILIENTQLEEAAVRERLEVLQRYETRLLKIKRNLSGIESSFPKSVKKVGAS